MRTPQDAKVIFTQDFEADWESWINTPVDSITQVEYYSREGASNSTFRPWTNPEEWQRGYFRDTIIILYNNVLVTDNAEEIANDYYPNDCWTTYADYSQERIDEMRSFGEDGGERYFMFESGEYFGSNSSWGSHTNEGYAASYRRCLTIPGLQIEDESSYRLTFYVKASKTIADAPSPRMYASVMRGARNSDKPFSMGYEYSPENYKYNNTFELQKDDFTGYWEKVTLMTYYLNDSIAENFFYSNGYWWADLGMWNWRAEENGTDHDLNYIVQPDKFFARLSFSSDFTKFQVDNLSLTKSWIGGAEYSGDKLRIDFGYETNLGDLAKAAKAKTNIAAAEVKVVVPEDKQAELGYEYRFEVWGLTEDDNWEEVYMRSAEYHDDGYMYMFTDFYEDPWSGDLIPIILDDYKQVLVTFHNPIDDPELTLQYTGNLFPKALDVEWIQNGKIVPDFYNEIATPNPYVFSGVYSLNDLPPVLQVAPYDEGSFGLDPADHFTFKFSREVLVDNYGAASLKAIGYVNGEVWIPSFNTETNELTITCPDDSWKNMSGDVEIKLIQLFGKGTDMGKNVVMHYHFGAIDLNPDLFIVQTDWKSEVTGFTRPYPTSVYVHSGQDPFKQGDGADSPGKCGLYDMNGEGLYNCGFYLSSRRSSTSGNLYSMQTLAAGNYTIDFRGLGWGSTSTKLVLYIYPKPEEELSDGDDYGFAILEAVENKVEIGRITQWNANITSGGDWKEGYTDVHWSFNVPENGEYVLEFYTDGSNSYQGVIFSNYIIKAVSDLSSEYIVALNEAVAAANARLAMAEFDLDIYGGAIYEALMAKKEYYEAGGEFVALNPTSPSDWSDAVRDMNAATNLMKLRMDTVDKFIETSNNVLDKLYSYEEYAACPAYATLSSLSDDAAKYPVTEKTGEEIYAFNQQMQDAMSALDARVAINIKFNDALAVAAALIDNAEMPQYEEYATLELCYDDCIAFDAYSAEDDDVAHILAILTDVTNAYKSRVSGASVLPVRVNALYALASDLGSDIVNNESLINRLEATDFDDDALADVFKAAIKLAIYEKIWEGDDAVYGLDITPFIKNYHLYQTAKVVERTDLMANSSAAHEADPDGANIQHVQHQWNSGNLNGHQPVWVMIQGPEYTDLYPGWTAIAYTDGNQMVTGDKTYDNYRNCINVFDAEIGMDWNSRAELRTELENLPVGQYTLGVELVEYNNSSSRNASLSVTVGDRTYSNVAYDAGAQLFAVDSIYVDESDILDVDFILQSASGWSRADNFYLTFNPTESYDYEFAIAEAEAELAAAMQNLDSTFVPVNPDPTTGLADWTSKNHGDGTSSSKTWKISNNETTTLKFNWSVSSEGSYDWLRITLDGNQIVYASGEQSGTYEDYLESGLHILVATYSKDGSGSSGSDQASVTGLLNGTIGDIIAQKIAYVREVAAGNSYINNVLLAEVNDYISLLEAEQYDTSEGDAIIAQLDEYAIRLAYKHLDISVPVQGSMGDSILAKVDNFVDVQSLRLTGKLNSDDLATLKNRLTSIIDLDLSGLDMATIPNEQFYGKTNLQYVILPANVQTIGNYAFYNCTNLKPIAFPTTLESIGHQAFWCTYKIGDVVLPEGLVSLGEYAFYQSGLTSVTFPSTLKSISYGCFQYCNQITSLKFPATLTSIGSYAFYNCRGLKEIEFNEGLISIGEYAFGYCDNLNSVTLPSSLQMANYYSFYYCNNLMQVTSKSIVPPYTNNGNITGRSGLDLYVPLLSVNVYKQTSGWDQFNIHGINIMPDNIVIQSDYKLNWPDSLTMDYKPNVTITDRDNSSYGSLTVNGNSTLSAGKFILKYDANISYNRTYWDSEWNTYYYDRSTYTTLVNNANVRADNIMIEYWMRANRWEFFTVPFDVKVSDIRMAFDGTPFVIRKYDGEKRAAGLNSETWVDMTADSILHAGEGYIWRSASTDPNNRNYTGFYLDALQTVNKNNIFANSNVEVPLAYYESEFAHNRSWNLTGNPYPSFYDIRAMQTSAPIIVWDSYQNNYRAYSPEDDSYILNPGQAFFVQRPVDEESIIFRKEGRQTNLEVRDIEYVNHASKRAPSVAASQRSVFNVVLSNGEQTDRTRFVINESANKDYDQGRDASKFSSLVPVSQLYTIENGVRYAINERPLSDGIIILGMTIATDGIYTLTLNTTVDQEVWLIDTLTGQEMLLNGDGGYTISVKAGTYDDRFELRMGNGTLTGVNNIATDAQRMGQMYDMQGRPTDATQQGIYIKDGKKVIMQ